MFNFYEERRNSTTFAPTSQTPSLHIYNLLLDETLLEIRRQNINELDDRALRIQSVRYKPHK